MGRKSVKESGISNGFGTCNSRRFDLLNMLLLLGQVDLKAPISLCWSMETGIWRFRMVKTLFDFPPNLTTEVIIQKERSPGFQREWKSGFGSSAISSSDEPPPYLPIDSVKLSSPQQDNMRSFHQWQQHTRSCVNPQQMASATFLKYRRMLLAGCVAAITVTGTWYGAGLKTRREIAVVRLRSPRSLLPFPSEN